MNKKEKSLRFQVLLLKTEINLDIILRAFVIFFLFYFLIVNAFLSGLIFLYLYPINFSANILTPMIKVFLISSSLFLWVLIAQLVIFISKAIYVKREKKGVKKWKKTKATNKLKN